ncbi:MAG: hypothetical protein KDK74_02880 [Cephaloticoccus sp.]|nr:hypothetical protein [Cephaloticoccus sp.]
MVHHSFTMKRKTKPAVTLLILLAASCWMSGCNTTTAKTTQPVLTVDRAELKTMWGGRIGEQLSAPAGPTALQPSDPQSGQAGSVSRQYRDWKRSQDS